MAETLAGQSSAREQARASHKAHRYAEAVPLYQQAMRENPLDFELWLRCGQAAADAGLLDVALPLLSTFVRMSPGDANAHFSLAFAYFRGARLDEAATEYRRATAIDPSRASAWCALGQIAYMQGDNEAGHAAHDAALTIPLTTPLSRFTTSVVRLLRGDYERGWADHEARWDVSQLPSSCWRVPGCTLWDGGELAGETLHVHAEGGYGDTIMLARYLPLLRRFGGPVHFHAQPGLASLLGGLADALPLPLRCDDEPPCDGVHCGSFSIPHLLHTRIDSIPGADGYLDAASDRSRPSEVTAREALRVGLVWAGNPNVVHDFDRSVPRLDVLAPLFQVPGIEWTSLQVGGRASEADGTPLRQLPPPTDYAATARAIEALDLVITVDTSVAHLAGALGRPVWTMIPTAPEFRWMLDRDDSPWYRSMRLFRRSRSDAWAALAHDVAAALAEHRDRAVAR